MIDYISINICLKKECKYGCVYISYENRFVLVSSSLIENGT